MSCTKHHEDITIAILAKKLPQNHIQYGCIWICKHSCKFNWSSGGWVQKLHYMHLEKAQKIKSLPPCNSLWKTTQVSYMAWPILSLGKFDKNQGKEQGLICKMATLQFIKGPNTKLDLTMLISSSSYPKIIYGMPLIAKRFKSDLNLNSNSNLN